MTSAVLVIDVQAGLFDGTPRPFEADEVVERINLVTATARAAGAPVILVQTEHPAFLAHGSEAWQLHRDLLVAPGDLRMRKSMANAFLGTDLDAMLKSRGVDTLVLCGYSSEFCIDSTLRYASALGYRIVLVSDAHTTHEKEHLSARQIREHHNITLSKSPTVTAVAAAEFRL